MNQQGPKVLLFDIETSPIKAYVWSIWDQNIPLDMIIEDWHVISWSAKWLGDDPKKMMYMDQRKNKRVRDDKKVLKGIWKLLDEADIVVTQNGKSFDQKKLNAKFIECGFKPYSPIKHIDTKVIAGSKFAFTSNKLEFLCKILNKKYKKLKHKAYPGFSMWDECMKGNQDAWKHMEVYNKYDVLALEEAYNKLQPWDVGVNFGLYTDDLIPVCQCGSKKFKPHKGYHYTNTGKFRRYQCVACGKPTRSRKNLFSKEKVKSLRVPAS